MLLPRPSFSSDLVRSHIAALSQNIGAEGRDEGAVFERCNFRKPPSSGLLANVSRSGKGTPFHSEKSSTVIPRRAIKVQSPARCGQTVYFVVPTLVGRVDQVSNCMPAKASTTRQLPLPIAYGPLATQPSTKHLRFDLRFD
jgi:hypothetical protein